MKMLSVMFCWLSICLLACAPSTQKAQQAESDHSKETSMHPVCSITLRLPEDTVVMSSTITELETRYRLITPQSSRQFLSLVNTQLENQGWRRNSSDHDKNRSLYKATYTCSEQTGILTLTFAPVGKSLLSDLILIIK